MKEGFSINQDPASPEASLTSRLSQGVRVAMLGLSISGMAKPVEAKELPPDTKWEQGIESFQEDANTLDHETSAFYFNTSKGGGFYGLGESSKDDPAGVESHLSPSEATQLASDGIEGACWIHTHPEQVAKERIALDVAPRHPDLSLTVPQHVVLNAPPSGLDFQNVFTLGAALGDIVPGKNVRFAAMGGDKVWVFGEATQADFDAEPDVITHKKWLQITANAADKLLAKIDATDKAAVDAFTKDALREFRENTVPEDIITRFESTQSTKYKFLLIRLAATMGQDRMPVILSHLAHTYAPELEKDLSVLSPNVPRQDMLGVLKATDDYLIAAIQQKPLEDKVEALSDELLSHGIALTLVSYDDFKNSPGCIPKE